MDPPKKNTRHPVFFSKKHHHLFLFHHFHMRFPVQISPKKSHPFRFLRTWGIWKPLILPCAAPRVGEKNTDWWYKLDSHGHESLGNVTECGNMNHGQTMDYLYPWTFVRNLETWHAIWKLQVFFGVISYSEKLKSGFLGKWTGSKLSCWTSSQKDSTFLHCLIVSISFKVFWFSTMETGWWSYMINDEHKHLQTRFFFRGLSGSSYPVWPMLTSALRDKAAAIAEKSQENHPRQLTIANVRDGDVWGLLNGCYVIYVCTEHGIMWANGQVIGLPVVSWFHHVWPSGD